MLSFIGCTQVLNDLNLFFLLICPPPTSTLFPYTTLFRSRVHRVGFAARGPAAFRTRHVHPRLDVRERRVDRKSTRLNSSHVSISYAVFCLKKKKSSTITTGESNFLTV